MLRERDTAMPRFDLGPAVRLALDPALTHLDHVLDDDTPVQAVQAEWARRRPQTRLEGRPSTPVEGVLRRLAGQPLSGGRAEATARWVSARLGLRPCCRV